MVGCVRWDGPVGRLEREKRVFFPTFSMIGGLTGRKGTLVLSLLLQFMPL